LQITIRQADTADAAMIADLSRETFYETFAHLNRQEDMALFMNRQFTRKMLMAEVSQPGIIFFLAEDEQGHPAGYAKVNIAAAPPGDAGANALEISRIYVRQEFMGKGVGKILMEKCIALADELKKAYIWLGVWKENKRAINFYERFGFVRAGSHDFLLGDDVQEDWIMKRQKI